MALTKLLKELIRDVLSIYTITSGKCIHSCEYGAVVSVKSTILQYVISYWYNVGSCRRLQFVLCSVPRVLQTRFHKAVYSGRYFSPPYQLTLKNLPYHIHDTDDCVICVENGVRNTRTTQWGTMSTKCGWPREDCLVGESWKRGFLLRWEVVSLVCHISASGDTAENYLGI